MLTYLIAVAIYTSFITLTGFYHTIPTGFSLILAPCIIAWHASLQHETIHGHPSSRPWLNELLILPCLWLWLPYRYYRRSHRQHHHNEWLTDPVHDPESFYLSEHQWQTGGFIVRLYYRCFHTLAGRLLLGPAHVVITFYRRVFSQRITLSSTDLWCHGIGSAIVVVWVVGVCSIPLHEYVFIFVYPAISLTLLRSYLEHQIDENPPYRTAIVETNRFWSLLFLNNNLHAIHHTRPQLPWYELPRYWHQHKAQVLNANNHYYYPGYAAIVRRYMIRPKEHPCHRLPKPQASSGPGAGPLADPIKPAL